MGCCCLLLLLLLLLLLRLLLLLLLSLLLLQLPRLPQLLLLLWLFWLQSAVAAAWFVLAQKLLLVRTLVHIAGPAPLLLQQMGKAVERLDSPPEYITTFPRFIVQAV